MSQLITHIHRFIIRAVTLCFLVTSVQPQMLFAQTTGGEDFEAPSLNVEEVRRGNLGEDQLFSVSAVDNIAVTAVNFFYRFSASEDFQQVSMEPDAGALEDQYSVTIATDDVTASSIQYYIQAEDEAGNRALKGYNFDPLERRLESSDPLASSNEPATKKKSRTLYYVLGILAVVAIGAAAGGGGGGGGGVTDVTPTGNTCNSSGCQVNLIIGAP